MIVSFQIGFRQNGQDGAMNASVDVPEGEVTVTQLLPVLQGLSSRIVDGVIQGAEQQISCRAGCGACCRQIVPISIFEAEALAERIRTLSEVQQAYLQDRFDRAVAELRDKGLLQRLDEWDANSEEAHALGLDYLRAGVPCPFLHNESCSIHPVRPVVCREYLVTSPAGNCAVPWDKQVIGVAIPVQLSAALRRMGDKVEGKGQGWLPLVLLMEWMKTGQTPGDAVRGTGQQVLGAVLGELKN